MIVNSPYRSLMCSGCQVVSPPLRPDRDGQLRDDEHPETAQPERPWQRQPAEPADLDDRDADRVPVVVGRRSGSSWAARSHWLIIGTRMIE